VQCNSCEGGNVTRAYPGPWVESTAFLVRDGEAELLGAVEAFVTPASGLGSQRSISGGWIRTAASRVGPCGCHMRTFCNRRPTRTDLDRPGTQNKAGPFVRPSRWAFSAARTRGIDGGRGRPTYSGLSFLSRANTSPTNGKKVSALNTIPLSSQMTWGLPEKDGVRRMHRFRRGGRRSPGRGEECASFPDDHCRTSASPIPFTIPRLVQRNLQSQSHCSMHTYLEYDSAGLMGLTGSTDSLALRPWEAKSASSRAAALCPSLASNSPRESPTSKLEFRQEKWWLVRLTHSV
jgi:hypothetical protein